MIGVDDTLLSNFSDEYFSLQTFRIDNATNFKILKQTIHEFWNFQQSEQEYNLYILEDNEINIIPEYDHDCLVDTFLKIRSSIEKAKFAYINNSKIRIL